MQTGTLSPVSNKADWIEAYGLYDDETGEPVDIADAEEITVEVKDEDDCGALLTATLTGDSIEHVETGIFQWAFTASQMGTLCPGTYPVKVRVRKDDIDTQIFVGFLPVVKG